MGRTLLAFLCIGLAPLVTSHREHKVHNIVLYPDKHSWCTTKEIKQVIGHPGCEQIELENNVCVGTCFSYSIPRTEPASPGQVAPYCDSCQPYQASWKHVTLKCDPNEVDGGTLSKRVEIIENCTCSSYSGHQPVPESAEIGNTKHETPQLLSLQQKNHSKEHYSDEHDRLAMSLKVLSDGEEVMGGQESWQLRKLIKDFIGKTEDSQELDHNTLQDIAQKAEEIAHNKAGLDTILSKLETSEHHQPAHRHHHKAHSTHHTLPQDDHAPILDVEHHHLKPAIEGSQIHYEPFPPGSKEEEDD